MSKQKLYSAGLLIYCSLISASNIQKAPDTIANKIAGTVTLISHEPVFTLPDFDLNPTALQFVKAYLQKNSLDLAKFKEINNPSFTIINSVFTKYDIPLELKYLAIVESNLNVKLVCNSGAAGIWQIMPVTASELGLKVTGDCDERFYIYKSSEAVAKYLKQLYAEFGDWLLVVAAYNTGPGNVNRAIRLSGSSDFWQLQNYLPEETRNHVKKFISVMYFFEEQNKTAMQQKSIARQTVSQGFSNNN